MTSAPRDTDATASETLARLRGQHVYGRSRDRRMLDLCPDYIAVFDSDFRMVDCNRAAFRAMRDPSLPKDALLKRPVVDYFPDLGQLGVYDAVLRVHREGGSFAFGDYQLKGFNLDSRIRCSVAVFKIDGVTVVAGEDVTAMAECDRRLRELASRLGLLELERQELVLALDVLARRQDQKALEVERNCQSNIHSLIGPLMAELESTALDDHQRAVFASLHDALRALTSDFSRSLHEGAFGLSPREVQIANLIRAGKATKEIAQLLRVSTKTIDFHRASLRRKLGLAKTGGDLRSCLLRDAPDQDLDEP
jgi:DNA-binding CsgD family transcriptional regulator